MLESRVFASTTEPGMAGLAGRAHAPGFRMAREDDTDRIDGSVPVWDDNGGGTGVPAAARGAEPFGFGDLVDMINPLQHIPLAGNLYRYLTGDEIKPISRIVGSAFFGGPLGVAASLANTALEEETGKSIAGNMMALALNETGLPQPGPVESLPGTVVSFADLGGRIAPGSPSAPLPKAPFGPPVRLASFSAFEIY